MILAWALTIWLFAYGFKGLAQFVRIKNMWIVLAILAFFMLTGQWWAALFQI